MKTKHIILITIISIFLFIALYFGLGYLGIINTRTIGKAQQNARREVFEQTQSYVEGKRQELIKLYHEWNNANTEDKLAIEVTIRLSFANFDETKIEQPELNEFLTRIKYK